MANNGVLTVKEVLKLTNIPQNTLYRYIRQGKIKSSKVVMSGKQVTVIKKIDIESFLGSFSSEVVTTGNQDIIGGNQWLPDGNILGSVEKKEKVISNGQNVVTSGNQDITTNYQDITSGKQWLPDENLKEMLKTVVKETISEERSQLMKPLEEQALFVSGKLSQENIFLKTKVETLLQEIEQYKALPCQIQERDEEIKTLETKLKKEKEILETKLLQEKEQALKELKISQQAEKAELEAMLKTKEEEKVKAKAEAEEALKKLTALPAPVESINQLLLDNANNLKELVTEKAKIETQLKDQNSTIKEKEHALKEVLEIHRQEIEKLKLQAEEEKKQIAEAWQKELELAKKPWWKFW